MPEFADAAADESKRNGTVPLDEVEHKQRPAFFLTWPEVKLLSITGVGFFLDAYDLFIINYVASMLQYRLYGGHSLPAGLEGFMKAGANIGAVIGQFLFGFLADALGRKAVYGKELMVIIFATILTISAPTGDISPDGVLIWIAVWRIVLGIGIGGDYPLSASVTSDRANLHKRGTMLAYIFANQGWGSFAGNIVTLVTLEAYKHSIQDLGHVSKVDGVWRIIIGVSLVPALATLYQRLTLPESKKFQDSQKPVSDSDSSNTSESELKKQHSSSDEEAQTANAENATATPAAEQLNETDLAASPAVKEPAHFKEFLRHFSKWRNLKILIGTCGSWFFLDIAFYGINLNQNVVLTQIGYAGKGGTPWENLYNITIGGLIVVALGFVPGYYATVLTIEYLGRKWIQIQGFLMAGLFLAILAGKFDSLSHAAFIVNFALLQFFFNFGANATTYVYPAEVFPTRYKAFAHGISAACGKAGAIISALAFNALSKKIGTPKTLWIFFGCCMAGALTTLLLPEVKNRDPDLVLAEELKAEREREGRPVA